MTARRFRLEIAGQHIVGLAFGSRAELEAFMNDRGLVAAAAPVTRTVVDEPHTRGRPSYDTMLALAVKNLRCKLRPLRTLTARSRLVLKYLAQFHGAEDIPALSTVPAFLSESLAEKVAENSAEKSSRAKIRRTRR